MDLIVTFLAGLALLVLLATLISLLLTVFILVPLAHFAPAPPMVARTSFDCPYSRRRVNVAFLTSPAAGRPSDVLSCSLFTDERGVRCKKGCLELAETVWTPRPVVARFALLADREASRNQGRSWASAPRAQTKWLPEPWSRDSNASSRPPDV